MTGSNILFKIGFSHRIWCIHWKHLAKTQLWRHEPASQAITTLSDVVNSITNNASQVFQDSGKFWFLSIAQGPSPHETPNVIQKSKVLWNITQISWNSLLAIIAVISHLSLTPGISQQISLPTDLISGVFFCFTKGIRNDRGRQSFSISNYLSLDFYTLQKFIGAAKWDLL